MKIGINASFARKENTGIGQVTLNFLRKLSERYKTEDTRYKNLEFFLYLEEDLDLELPEGFTKQIFLPLWKRDDLIRKIWWEKYLLPRKAKQDGCDVFISLYQCTTILPAEVNPHTKNTGTIALIKKLFSTYKIMPFGVGVKHIMVVQDIIPKLFPEYLNNSRKKKYWKLTEKAITQADRLIAISKRTEKDLVQHLGIDPAKITTNYLDVDEIYKENISTEKSAKILKKYKLTPGYLYHGGGLEVRKNTESVIRAYKILLEKFAGSYQGKFPQLVISGKLMPELAPLVVDAEKLVKELNLTKNVVFLDFVPQKDLPVIYAQALMFIFPSKYEGFGLPILEAMNQGTPVITSKTSSLPEVGGDAVLYCDPEDIYDLAMVMKKVLTDENIRHTLSVRGKDRAKNFSWNKFVEKVLHVLENL